jgi:atypical dual specificity phosphatase
MKHSVLPKNFSWLEEGKVAGCVRPENVAELNGLKESGIKTIISLTGTPLNSEHVKKLGFEYLHEHVSGAPSIEQLHRIVSFIDEQNRHGRPVVVHCGEGRGRTGTILAAYLIVHGRGAEDAMRIVREKRSGSIQNEEQESLIRKFGEAISQH